ncbi:MAG: hypothetical protein H6772_02500 [Pseudomonadales bacterium]|nr:hypothetical protein [Pseudomonadales bacterium]
MQKTEINPIALLKKIVYPIDLIAGYPERNQGLNSPNVLENLTMELWEQAESGIPLPDANIVLFKIFETLADAITPNSDGKQVIIGSTGVEYDIEIIKDQINKIFNELGLITVNSARPASRLMKMIEGKKSAKNTITKADLQIAINQCTAITRNFGLRNSIQIIVGLLLIDQVSNRNKAENVTNEILRDTPEILPTATFSFSSPYHENHDVYGHSSFQRAGQDGTVDRYVVGDGSGGSGATDIQTQKKMTAMRDVVMNASLKDIHEAIILADKAGKILDEESNRSYGVMVGVDVIRNKNGKIEAVNTANVGDAVVLGWRPNGFTHRRSSTYPNRGDESNITLYSDVDNLASVLKQSELDNIKTGSLDTDARANVILHSMGSTDKQCEPKRYQIDQDADDFPQILILCTDGLQPNKMTVPEEAYSRYVNKLLTDYTTGQGHLTLDEIAKNIAIFARNKLFDEDDITITLIDLRSNNE